MLNNNHLSQDLNNDLKRLEQLSMNQQDFTENYNYNINCLFRTIFFAHAIKQGRQVRNRLSELSQSQSDTLAYSDLPNIQFLDTCLKNGKEAWFKLDQKIKINQVSIFDLYKQLFLIQKKLLFIIVFYFVIHVISRVGASLFIYFILQAVRNDQKIKAYILASLTGICLIIDRISFNNGLLFSSVFDSRLRSTIIFLIHYKISTLSNYWIKKIDMGSILNMISSDLNRIQKKMAQLFIALAAIVGIIASTILLFFILGWTCFIAILIIGLGYLLDMVVGKIIAIYLEQASNHKDKRINMVSQIIQGVKFIKLYGWEKAFQNIIKKIRRKQEKNYLKFALGSGIERAFGNFAYLAIIITLAITYYIDNEKLNMAIIFSAIEVSSVLKRSVYFASLGGVFVFKLNVIFSRLSNILNVQNIRAVEIDPATKIPVNQSNNLSTTQDLLYSYKTFDIHEIIIKTSKDFPPLQSQTGQIILRNFNGYWDVQDLSAPSLKNINIHFQRNLLYGIAGKISSGKSGLLGAILKQIPYYSGSIDIAGKISYVEQQPSIFEGTIKSNVLFGREMNQERYTNALKYSCLSEDLNTIQGRDQGLVGEKGNTLSGGQKRRLSLARALYADSDIYLLDDPLSAVDPRVAEKIFTKCFKEFLKNKTVLFCSHQSHFLHKCDKVIIMNNGSIQNQGTPENLKIQLENLNICTMNVHQKQSRIENQNIEVEIDLSSMKEQTVEKVHETIQILNNLSNITVVRSQQEQTKKNIKRGFKFRTLSFFKYIFYNKVNIILFPILILLFVSGEIIYFFFSKFLAEYDNQLSQASEQEKKFGSIDIFWIITISFMVIYCLLVLVKFFIIYVSCIKSTTKILHDAIQTSVRAQTSFFDKDESNGLINKFSNDISILDQLIPNSIYDWLQGAFIAVIKISSIFTINPYFIPFGVLNLIIPVIIYLYFKNTIIQTKSLYLQTKNNIYKSINKIASGSIPIKIYDQKFNEIFQFSKTVDNSMRCSLSVNFINRGFTMSLAYSTQILIAAGILIGVFSSTPDTVGQLGILIIFLLQANADIQFCLKQHMVVETQVLSAERALEILKIPTQSSLKVDYDDQIGANAQRQQLWPKNPKISIQNLSMRYRPQLSATLKNLNLQIDAYERVGIVGRTGAGKSSIVQAMLRMYEPQQGAKYEIGGDNALKMGLHSLRHHITVIPQSPFLFEGTIRENLDPLQQCCDQEIWQALKNSGLAQCIQKLPEKLQTQIYRESEVFSQGQKQLICLARALLKKNKILILDEATSNVDMHTDDFIQKVLKEKFKNTTILTIAHRLNTIADYDKIIVMNEGQAVQVGTPHQLILKKGLFAKMIQRTGKNAEKIKKIALTKHKL